MIVTPPPLSSIRALLEVLPGKASRLGRHVLRRPLSHNLPAPHAALWLRLVFDSGPSGG